MNSGQTSEFLQVLDDIMMVFGIADLRYSQEVDKLSLGHQLRVSANPCWNMFA